MLCPESRYPDIRLGPPYKVAISDTIHDCIGILNIEVGGHWQKSGGLEEV